MLHVLGTNRTSPNASHNLTFSKRLSAINNSVFYNCQYFWLEHSMDWLKFYKILSSRNYAKLAYCFLLQSLLGQCILFFLISKSLIQYVLLELASASFHELANSCVVDPTFIRLASIWQGLQADSLAVWSCT